MQWPQCPKSDAISPDKHLLATWRFPTPEVGTSLSRRMGCRAPQTQPDCLPPPSFFFFLLLSVSVRNPLQPLWPKPFEVLSSGGVGESLTSSCRNSNGPASLFNKRCSLVTAKGTRLWPCPESDSPLPLPGGSQNLAFVPPAQTPACGLDQVTAVAARLTCSSLVPVSLSCPPEGPTASGWSAPALSSTMSLLCSPFSRICWLLLKFRMRLNTLDSPDGVSQFPPSLMVPPLLRPFLWPLRAVPIVSVTGSLQASHVAPGMLSWA